MGSAHSINTVGTMASDERPPTAPLATTFTAATGSPRVSYRPRAQSTASTLIDLAPASPSPSTDDPPSIVTCYCVQDRYWKAEREGNGYRAYSTESITGHADWLVVPDNEDQPQEFRQTMLQFCELMLALKGKSRAEGIEHLKRHESLGARTRYPADPLLGMSDMRLMAEAIRDKIKTHQSVILQGGDKALVISRFGIGQELGPAGLTVQDPAEEQYLAVFDYELADVIARLCPPDMDYQLSYAPLPGQLNTVYRED
ncbi:hypothetical protein [Bordetella sp. N]|uniref:hypothetical protein n=1 Tax=Bordetella sp. N TaxID=1746199 RepID=UPI00070CBD2A|nr:hypothetical protein [Bordetella sp. N]ALM84140.1 hypothetical protein ASB57_15205 [Bordetella sp. N]